MKIDLSSEDVMKATVAFYDQNAEDFVGRTYDADMSAVNQPFLELLPEGAHILDAGCGSGRDSLFFIQNGYQVTAIDASEEMVRIASQQVGQPVIQLFFHQIEFESCFDGIWACASLIHIPCCLMDEVFDRLTRALKLGGIFYASFKYGEGEVIRGGRLFNCYNETSFRRLLSKHNGLSLIHLNKDRDRRIGRKDEFWLNVLMQENSI